MDYEHFDVLAIVRGTDKAFLLRMEDSEVWVPKSVIADAEDYEQGDTDATVSIAEWWVAKNM